MNLLAQLINVPTADPDDARRRRLLNILLLGLGIIILAALLVTTLIVLSGLERPENASWLYLSSLVTLAGIAIIYSINRYWRGWIASILFLLVLSGALAFTDTPPHVIQGRSLFMFTLPILISSVILRPYASFITAGLIGFLLLPLIAFNAHVGSEAMGSLPFTALAFMTVALVAWLAARTMEQALYEVRLLNVELEQRVADRTRDLAEALSKNQAILESIADGVIVFDNAGKATLANPAIEQLIQQSPQGIIANNLETLMGDNVSLADRQRVEAVLKDPNRHHPNVKLQWGSKTLSVSFAPIRVEPGQITGTVAVFRDFTREAEVDRMKSAIVSMVSHDLRTPLNAVLGYAEMLEEAVFGPLSEKQQETMQRISANAKRLLSLVNDLLDQAQLEAGRLKLKVTSFTSAELLESVKSVMSILAQSKGLELTTEIAADLPATLQGDPQRLQQILINLAGNALKFTDTGSVHIRLYRHNPDYWAMEVTDTGPGIPPDKLSRVFERFYQVDDVATRKHQGVGLGLAIVKQLVAMMGGQINVQSQLGKGSTFTVLLPFTPHPQEDTRE